MNKEDYKDLIEVADELDNMDGALINLTGFSHSEGEYRNVDKVYEVLQRNSKYFSNDDLDDRFFDIRTDKRKSIEERANMLMKDNSSYRK